MSEKSFSNHLIGFAPGDARCAVLTGNPDRVPVLADMLGATTARGSRRGFAWSVVDADPPVIVCSTGVGAPAAAIAVEELADLGIESIVRIGSCGALSEDVAIGSLVVSTGCVRHEGTTSHYVDLAYPAVPGYRLLVELVNRAADCPVPVHFGLTHCKDAYYSEHPDRGVVDRERVRSHWAALRASGVLATEMEAAALFVIGQLRGIQCATILVPASDSARPDTLHETFGAAVDLARGALPAGMSDAA